jgi:hypothetical protein
VHKGICLNVGGGLGDILRVLLCGDVGYPWCEAYWGMLESWKADTNRHIKLVVSSHNPSAVELFKYAPWVDELITIPWRNDGTMIAQEFAGLDHEPFTLNFQRQIEHDYKSVWKKPKIYMTQAEKNEANEIISGGKYVLLYPFGGYGARIQVKKYISLVEKLNAEGIWVVIVGDSYKRSDVDIIEKWNYEASLVINLVGRDNCRLTSYLATKAFAYVGSLGCYMHPAIASYIKIVALTCFEIWQSIDVLSNDAMWYFRRYTGMYKNFADIICFYNETNLDELWTKVVQRLMTDTSSQFSYWGNAEEKRGPIKFPMEDF